MGEGHEERTEQDTLNKIQQVREIAWHEKRARGRGERERPLLVNRSNCSHGQAKEEASAPHSMKRREKELVLSERVTFCRRRERSSREKTTPSIKGRVWRCSKKLQVKGHGWHKIKVPFRGELDEEEEEREREEKKACRDRDNECTRQAVYVRVIASTIAECVTCAQVAIGRWVILLLSSHLISCESRCSHLNGASEILETVSETSKSSCILFSATKKAKKRTHRKSEGEVSVSWASRRRRETFRVSLYLYVIRERRRTWMLYTRLA